MRLTFGASALLSAWVGIAALAACGGAQQPGPNSSNEALKGTPLPSEPSSAGTAPTTSGSAGAAAPTTSAAVPTPTTSAFVGPMKPVAASTLVADLQALGLDPKNLPPLSKLEPDKLRKVMRTFTKALGARCADCHIESDFAASTPMKKIAAGHWDEFVRKLSTDAGAPVYCDSCHQARLKILDRTDKKALGAWMDSNFVDHFKRRDGKENGCETCHGDPFEGRMNARFLK